MIRTYTELSRIPSFEERFDYLRLLGNVGESTFGFERYLNQQFYRSHEWKTIRKHVIARDVGYDLGILDFPIMDRVIIHHMNPMVSMDLIDFNTDVLNPEYLITTSQATHNAIHYGDASLLRKKWEPRRPGDTLSW